MTDYSPSDWAPGDVALVTFDSDDYVAVRGHSLWSDRWFTGGPVRGSTLGWQLGWRDTVLDRPARRLVVIDPEDRVQVEEFAQAYVATWHGARRGESTLEITTRQMQVALREFATPQPRIEEPTLPGAVIKTTDGKFWVRGEVLGEFPWTSPADAACADWAAWSELDVVKVLSPGVEVS